MRNVFLLLLLEKKNPFLIGSSQFFVNKYSDGLKSIALLQLSYARLMIILLLLLISGAFFKFRQYQFGKNNKKILAIDAIISVFYKYIQKSDYAC